MFTIKKYLSEIMLAFPCPGCGEQEVAMRPNRLCDSCRDQLKLIQPPICAGCGGAIDGVLELCVKCMREELRPWGKAFSLFELSGYGQELVQRFKYNNRPELARALGGMISEVFNAELDRAGWLVPVPLHWSRYWFRGYNQSRLICRIIAEQTGITMKDLLIRRRRTKQQAKLSREQRKLNLTNAFLVKRGVNCKNRTILLFDDVITTGATLTAAANVLLDAGVSNVYIITIGRR
jgi:ComF family protein